jgi:hypothetical protein
LERLFLYYRGNRSDVLVRENLQGFDEQSVCRIDARTLVLNYFRGGFNTAKHFLRPDFSVWLNGVYVHRDKGIACCIDDIVFNSLWTDVITPEDIPSRFINGAFCGLVITPAKTYVFNDFMGLSPVYYYHEKGEIIISSSFSFLAGIVKTSLNKSAVSEYLQTGYNFSGDTVVGEIKCLGPASMLSIGKNNRISITSYDSFSNRTEIRRPLEDTADEILLLLNKSINRLYDSRIKYSMSMTGGIDSRLIYLLWSNKQNLLTETAGEGSSDYLKAGEIIERLGNPELHSLENLFPDNYAEGFDRYYNNCDNPMKAMGEFNSYHLDWKIGRGSFLHLSGVGGELLDGENLYLSRDKWSVAREAFTSYHYHELKEKDKEQLLGNVLGTGNKKDNLRFAIPECNDEFKLGSIAEKLDKFIGKTKFSECYTERFRTYRLANAGYYLSGSQNLGTYLTILPYNDTDLIKAVCRYHPSTRELRRLTLALLKSFDDLKSIPIDTTHLKINAPYELHRFFRVLRMVLNVGYHKKIPFLQKGEPPRFRAFPYFNPLQADFRELVNTSLLNCSWFSRDEIRRFIREISSIKGFNFYLHHGAEANILILQRLAYMEKMLNGRNN